MVLYSLEANSFNDGEYEDYRSYDYFYGVFSTIEKAKEYAEKKMEQIRKEYRDEPFEVNEDWHECGKSISKEVYYGEGYSEEWTETYCINKVTVDPEFKED